MSNRPASGIGFDTVGFMADVLRVAKSFKTNQTRLADETGVKREHLSMMKRGRRGMPTAPAIAALGVWAGVNPALYATLHGKRLVE